MPNDAKFGLVVGVGLVVAAAVMFFQRPPAEGPPTAPSGQNEPKNRAATPAMLPPPSSLPKPEGSEPRD